MTELERMLKDTLTEMERDLAATLENHSTRLAGQQNRLETQSQYIQELHRSINLLQAEQQESAKLLHGLCDAYMNLEPLLARLNALLNAK